MSDATPPADPPSSVSAASPSADDSPTPAVSADAASAVPTTRRKGELEVDRLRGLRRGILTGFGVLVVAQVVLAAAEAGEAIVQITGFAGLAAFAAYGVLAVRRALRQEPRERLVALKRLTWTVVIVMLLTAPLVYWLFGVLTLRPLLGSDEIAYMGTPIYIDHILLVVLGVLLYLLGVAFTTGSYIKQRAWSALVLFYLFNGVIVVGGAIAALGGMFTPTSEEESADLLGRGFSLVVVLTSVATLPIIAYLYLRRTFSTVVSLRYLRTRLISLFAMGGITVGVMVLVITTAIMGGFKEELRKRIRGSLSHCFVQVTPPDYAQVRYRAKIHAMRIVPDGTEPPGTPPDGTDPANHSLPQVPLTEAVEIANNALMRELAELDGYSLALVDVGEVKDEDALLSELRRRMILIDIERMRRATVLLNDGDYRAKLQAAIEDTLERGEANGMAGTAYVTQRGIAHLKEALALLRQLGRDDQIIAGASGRLKTMALIIDRDRRDLDYCQLVGIDPVHDLQIGELGDHLENALYVELNTKLEGLINDMIELVAEMFPKDPDKIQRTWWYYVDESQLSPLGRELLAKLKLYASLIQKSLSQDPFGAAAYDLDPTSDPAGWRPMRQQDLLLELRKTLDGIVQRELDRILDDERRAAGILREDDDAMKVLRTGLVLGQGTYYQLGVFRGVALSGINSLNQELGSLYDHSRGRADSLFALAIELPTIRMRIEVPSTADDPEPLRVQLLPDSVIKDCQRAIGTGYNQIKYAPDYAGRLDAYRTARRELCVRLQRYIDDEWPAERALLAAGEVDPNLRSDVPPGVPWTDDELLDTIEVQTKYLMFYLAQPEDAKALIEKYGLQVRETDVAPIPQSRSFWEGGRASVRFSPIDKVLEVDFPAVRKRIRERAAAVHNRVPFDRFKGQLTGDGASETAPCIIGDRFAEAYAAMPGDLLLPSKQNTVHLATAVALESDSSYDLEDDLDFEAREASFHVAGLFHSMLYEDDRRRAYIPLDVALDFLDGAKTEITLGIKLTGRRYEQPRPYQSLLKAAIAHQNPGGLIVAYGLADTGSVVVNSWEEEKVNLLKAVDREQIILNIVLSFLILLAGVMIVIVITLMVNEKTKDIGILKALGGSPAGIQSIFLFNGLFIGLFGTLLGLLVGLLVVFNSQWVEDTIERLFGFRIFPAEVYYLTYIPTKTDDPLVWVLIAIPTILFAFFCGLYPAYLAARKAPVDALQYE